MKEKDSSVNTILKIQARQKSRKPFVVYANEPNNLLSDIDFSAIEGSFSSLLVQPTTELIKHWSESAEQDANETTGMLSTYKSRGFGICLDLEHYTKPGVGGESLPDWQDAFPVLARSGQVQEVHVGPNRNNLPSHADDGKQLRMILAGNIGKTTLGKQLQLFSSQVNEPVLPNYVIEVTASQALEAVQSVSKTGSSNTGLDLTYIHRDLTAAIRQILE